MTLVKPGLHIGGRDDVDEFNSHLSGCVLRIITVDAEPLKLGNTNVVMKFVRCLDEPNADILSTFDDCVNFIAEGVDRHEGCEAVLVHCFAGMSRSATVVLAYLMKEHKLCLDEAYKELKRAYPKANPNPGFMKQLELYEAMGNAVDRSSSVYKQYRLELLANQIKDQGHASEEQLSSLIEDFKYEDSANGKEYKCRKCRKMLFHAGHLMVHEVGQGQLSFKWHKQEVAAERGDGCTSYFIEPVDWMLPLLEGSTSGKISCLKCKGRLGSFNWAGMQCSCGAWVTPAFQFHKNRIDETSKLTFTDSIGPNEHR